MLRIRSGSLLSGASALAIITGLASGTAQATDTFTGPNVTFDPITNTATDNVVIHNQATIARTDNTPNGSTTAADAHFNSFFNNLSMSSAVDALGVDDSFLLGDIENVGSMVSTGLNAISLGNDSHIGGRIFNGGYMEGKANGIIITTNSTVSAGIFNVGSIIGNNGDGIRVDVASEILGGIGNTGLIKGEIHGIGFIDADDDFGGGITNSGTIQNVGAGGAGIYFAGHTFLGGISNSKLIAGTTTSDGVLITAGTFNGGIANTTGGTISGDGAGKAAIHMTAGTFQNGDIVNDATISGTNAANGIWFEGGTMSGNIANHSAGTITVEGNGIGIDLSGTVAMSGGITNAGSILAQGAGGTGIGVFNTATLTGGITNTSTGKILADSSGIYTNNTLFASSISNSGSIVSTSQSGINEHSTTFTGNITNELGGLIDGHDSGIITQGTAFNGNVVNNGSIHAATATGLLIENVTFTGGVTNSGTINAGANGIQFDGTTLTQSITNDGTITAATNGIVTSGTVNGGIVNTGLIDPQVGIKVTGNVVGGISNSGSILATQTGIDISGELNATAVTQTAGLLRGNASEDGTGLVATALNMDNANTNTFSVQGGVIDGNVLSNDTDIMDMSPDANGTAVWLRGTAGTLGTFHAGAGGETGQIILGASHRGDQNGAGVSITAEDVSFDSGASVYLDKKTTVHSNNDFFGGEGEVTEFYLTSNTAQHAVVSAAGAINTDSGNIKAYVDGTTFGSAGGDHFLYTGVMQGATASGTTGDIDTNSLFFEGKAIFNTVAGRVDIELNRLSFTDALIFPLMTQNETTIGNALEDIYALGPIAPGGYGPNMEAYFNWLLSLGAGDQALALASFDEISGAEHAQEQQTLLDILNPFGTFMGQRLDEAKSGLNGVYASNARQQYAQAMSIMSDASPGLVRGSSGVSIWGRGYGQQLSADGDPEAPGFDQDTSGAVGGFDVTVGNSAILGAAVGWSNSDVDFNTPGDHADVDSIQVGAYGSYGFGHLYLDGELAGAFNDLSTRRFLNLPPAAGGPLVAGADYSARTFYASGEFGGIWQSGNWMFQPNAGAMFTDVDTNAFIESGAGDFDLVVGDNNSTSFASAVGMRIATLFHAGSMPVMPEVGARWRHEFDDGRQTFSAAFPDDPTSTFTIISSKVNPDSALVEAGLTAGITRGVEVFVNYNGLWNSDVTVDNGSIGIRGTW